MEWPFLRLKLGIVWRYGWKYVDSLLRLARGRVRTSQCYPIRSHFSSCIQRLRRWLSVLLCHEGWLSARRSCTVVSIAEIIIFIGVSKLSYLCFEVLLDCFSSMTEHLWFLMLEFDARRLKSIGLFIYLWWKVQIVFVWALPTDWSSIERLLRHAVLWRKYSWIRSGH